MHVLAVELAVGSGEVHELEEAELGVDPVVGERMNRAEPGGVDDDHLAGRHLAYEARPHDVEGRSL
ncbi:MAG: hypothetical protein ACERLM_08690, partial [Acidimicrobiales bacterium]